MDEIGKRIGAKGAPWTANARLPGGDFPVEGRGALAADLLRSHPFLARTDAERLVRQYGTLSREVLGSAADTAGLGTHFGAGLYEREVEWLMAHEWARTADDVLWRRTKLGLRLDKAAATALDEWMKRAAARGLRAAE